MKPKFIFDRARKGVSKDNQIAIQGFCSEEFLEDLEVKAEISLNGEKIQLPCQINGDMACRGDVFLTALTLDVIGRDLVAQRHNTEDLVHNIRGGGSGMQKIRDRAAAHIQGDLDTRDHHDPLKAVE